LFFGLKTNFIFSEKISRQGRYDFRSGRSAFPLQALRGKLFDLNDSPFKRQLKLG
jgi:hypothetical protein